MLSHMKLQGQIKLFYKIWQRPLIGHKPKECLEEGCQNKIQMWSTFTAGMWIILAAALIGSLLIMDLSS